MSEADSDAIFIKAYNERIAEITQSFDSNIKEIVEPHKTRYLQNRTQIIRIAELIYRPNSANMPPNWNFSIIDSLLQGKNGVTDE
jgi:hypothetical protein